MHGARQEDSSLSIDDNGLPVVGDATLDELKPQNKCKAESKNPLGG